MSCYRRLREAKSETAKYVLNLETLAVSDNFVEAELKNTEVDVTFELVLTSLSKSIFRVFINEIKPLHPRYEVEGALATEPQVAKYRMWFFYSLF